MLAIVDLTMNILTGSTFRPVDWSYESLDDPRVSGHDDLSLYLGQNLSLNRNGLFLSRHALFFSDKIHTKTFYLFIAFEAQSNLSLEKVNQHNLSYRVRARKWDKINTNFI